MRPGGAMHAPRVGAHRDIFARLLARVHDYPIPDGPFAGTRPLRGLSLDASDPAIALLDGWATLVDILSFYQERIAAEGYLRTALEPRSIHELVSFLGVCPSPALAAEVELAFTVRGAAPGASEVVTIPAGAAAQSRPRPGERPVAFETVEAIEARSAWNALSLAPPPNEVPWLRASAEGMLVEGSAAGAGPGAVILLTGRIGDTAWSAVKFVRRTGQARRRGLTLLLWDEPLDPDRGDARIDHVSAQLGRAPLRLLGADAPDWAGLPLSMKTRYSPIVGGLVRLDRGQPTWVGLEQQAQLGGTVTCLLAGPGEVVVAGVAQRGLLRSADGGRSFAAAPAGPAAGAEVLCLGRDGDRLLAGTTDAGVLRSADDGRTWEVLRGTLRIDGLSARTMQGLLPPVAVRSVAGFTAGAGSRAAAYVLAGTDAGLYLWEESSRTWTSLNAGLPLSHGRGDAVPVQIRAIAMDPVVGAFYLGTDHGLFATRELGVSWGQLVLRLPGEEIETLATAPDGTLYVAPRSGGLAWTRDGTSWSWALDKVTIHSLVVHGSPDEPPCVVAATPAGIHRSIDGGRTWDVPGGGAARRAASVAVTPDGALLAGTPVEGVADATWPGWPLALGRLELVATARPPATGDPLALVQPGLPGRLVRAGATTATRGRRFGSETSYTVVELDPADADLTAYDRGRAAVVLAGSPLTVAAPQLRGGRIEAPPTGLDALLGDGAALAALTRAPLAPASLPATELIVDGVVPDATGRRVIVTGRRVRVLSSPSADGVAPAAELTLLERPTPAGGALAWRTRDERGRLVLLTRAAAQVSILAASPDGETAAERRVITACVAVPGRRTRIVLDRPLTAALDPSTVVVLGNIARACQGVTADEVLGSSDGSPDQRFVLRRAPLTFTSKDGTVEPALEVRVDGVRWAPAARRFEQRPGDRTYVLEQRPDGGTAIRFGDGVHGALPPSGQENVTARYRAGAGTDGNVDAERITFLPSRPPGVAAVTNPLPASGGVAREADNDLAERAPLEVRTVDRVVSLGDFASFVRTFPGVARARSRAVWNGHRHQTVITVATTDAAAGHALGAALRESLHGALRRAHFDPGTVAIVSFQPRWFELEATLAIDPAHSTAEVLAAATAAVSAAFSFARSRLAQPVAASEIIGVLARERGVLGVRIGRLSLRGEPPAPRPPALLRARDARWDPTAGDVAPAEMLLLTEDGPTLTAEAAR